MPERWCDKEDCDEHAIVAVEVPTVEPLNFCISHMRDFYRYVADRLEAAERADEEAERASR